MKVGKIKRLSKKSLSVLLAVIMIMSSMSVAFGSITFAAGGNVADSKWNEFIAALKNDTVKNASFNTSSANNYTVIDPDGKIIAAVELYFEIFDTLADKAPAGSSAGNRTINQVNTSIKNTLSSKMSADYATYNIDSFITKLMSGANVSASKGAKIENETGTAPGTNLGAVSAVNLNVALGGELTKYASIDDLPDEVATTKTFTVTHKNTNYDSSTRTENITNSCGDVTGTKTIYGFEYYYSISGVSENVGAKQSTKVLKDTAKTFSDNSKYLDATLAQMVQFIIDDVQAVKDAQSAIVAAKNNAVTFSSAAWDQYFKATYDSKISALASNITLATEIVTVGEVAFGLVDLKDAGYAGKDEAGLRQLYADLTQGLSTYDKATQPAKDYINNSVVDGKTFVRADIQAFADEVKTEIQIIELRKLKANIDSTIPAYYGYNEDNVMGESATVSGATLSTAKGTVEGFRSSLNSYPQSLVNSIMSGYSDTLTALSAELARLIKVSGYDDQFSAEYAKYVAEVYAATALDADSETLLAGIESYDSWYSGLKTLIGKIEGELGQTVADKIMKDLDDKMKAHMDAVYVTLHARVDAQINIATELYAVVAALNGKIDVLTVNNYSKYKKAFENIEKNIYDFLIASPNFAMPQETINKYNALSDDFTKFENFLATGGFNSFAQQTLDYQNRDVLGNDLVRDEEYEVTKAKLEKVIKGLDKAITSDEIGALLGGLLSAEEGAEFDIGAMLTDIIGDMLFSDSLINTIVQALYPLVLSELIKVWEKDLPTKITDPVTANITYNKTLDVIAVEAGLPLFPADVADSLNPGKYADNISKLKTAGTSYKATKVYDENGKITEVIVDETPWTAANPNLLNEDGTLTLTWGVDAAKQAGVKGDALAEVFYHAFDDALHCLKPLLHVLIANTAWESNQVRDVASINAKVIFTINDNAHLTIGASACAGYANFLVPIFEALGAKVEGTEDAAYTFKSPETIESYAKNSTDSAADMLRAIFEPVFGLVNNLSVAPVDTIISILPNLCYALSMQMVPTLLGMLGTKLDIGVQLNNSTLQSCVGGMLADLLPSMDLNLADMININDIIDLSNGVNSLLTLLGLNLPEIDQGLIAQLGTMDKITSARYATAYDKSAITKVSLGENEAITINADKAAVGYYLLTYIFGIIEDEEAFRGLLGLLMTTELEDGTKVPDTAKIDETIASFNEMGLFGYGTGNAIAAIVELFNQEKNTNFSVYNWYEDPLFDGTITGLTPAMIEYLSYDNDLTKEKAAYIVEHLDELISSVLDMINGNPEGTFSIAEKLEGLIGGLFTNNNITALAKALSALDLNALLAGSGEENTPETAAEGGEGEAEADPAIDINTLIKDILGIDLTLFTQYKDIADDTNWGFADGDGEGFAQALADVLAPLNPVIDFILKGKNLEAIKDETGAVITLLGYNGYDTAIVPLLEALGCEVTELKDSDNAIEVILKAIVKKLDTIIGEGADAVEGLANLLPGVLYFLQSNALAIVVDNLLHPIYVLLDTIRPIYDINLDEILAGLLKNMPVELDLNNLDFDFVVELVKSLTGLDFTDLGTVVADVCKVAAVDYESKSSIIGEDGRKGAYTSLFDATDLVAVILNFAFDWCTVQANVDALAAVIGGDNAETTEKVKKYIAGIYSLIEGIEPEYGTIDWAHNFPDGFDADDVIFSSGISVKPTIESLNYPTNWTEDTAKYLDEHLEELIAEAFKLAGMEGESLSDMLKKEINFFTGANLNKIVTLLTDLLGKLNSEIVNNAGVLIGADLDALKAYKADDDKTYTTVEFAKELAKILSTIPEVVNLVFFADDFEIFNYGSGETVGTIKGAYGYAKGLAPILEALGCENLPTADSNDVEGVLVALAERFDEILVDPIAEILDILPNVIYFLNANGVSVSLKNILSSVTGFMTLLKESFGVDVDLIKIINDAINGLLPEESTVTIDVTNLTLENIILLAQGLLGLELDAAAMILTDLCVGKIEPFVSVSGDYGFRMVYNDDFARYDMITILATVALMLVENEQNAAKLDEMFGTEIMKSLKDVFADVPVKYAAPDWDYCWAEDGIDYDNGTVDVIKYAITYPNDWTKADAQYLADNLSILVDTVVALASDEESLKAVIDKNLNIYKGENIKAIVDMVTGLLDDIDDTLLDAAGVLLGVDITGLKSYKAPEGTMTSEAFAKELANVLTTYAGGLVEWLLLGKDYRFFVDETVVGDKYEIGEEIITVNGGQGYAEGLALVLEALGCENLPEVYGTENLDTKAVVEAVLMSLAARLDEILANPVDEVFVLLPNLLYFLNANGVAIAFDNLLAALTNLIAKLEGFGVKLDIAELINLPKLLGIEDKNVSISVDNLTIAAILEAVSTLTGLDLEKLENVLVGFALGEVKEYDSVSTYGTTYKMYYNDDFAKCDMITVLLNAALLVVTNEDNAKALDEMLGTEIITALKTVFESTPVKYASPDWQYCWADNDTMDIVKYAITYPNNWTQESAEYVADHLVEFGDMIATAIDSNYDSLAALAQDKVKLYKGENIQSIVDAVTALIGDIDAKLLEAAGVILGADIEGLKAYKAPEGEMTADEFAHELATVLTTYAGGLVDWLLFGDDYAFFVSETKNNDGTYADLITVNGGHGYAEGLALILEALGCKNLPDVYSAENLDTAATVEAVLKIAFARLDETLANPVDEVFALLPNLLYFLNANGVAIAIDNTIGALDALLIKLEGLGIELNIAELINIEKLLGIEEDLKISIDNLTVEAILEVVAYLTGFDLKVLEDVLVGFALGAVNEYDSVSRHGVTYKMYYNDEFAVYDMITVLANLVILTAKDEDNSEKVENLLGKDVYQVVTNIFNLGRVPVQEFDWKFKDKADTGFVFSAIETSNLYSSNHKYGPLYTEEMAQYIASNVGDFIDNVIYLLGISIDGNSVDNLKDLINGLVNGSIYNSKNVIAIRDALAGVLEGIGNMQGGDHIKAILKKSLGVDLDAVAKVEVPEFDNDRALFTQYLCDVIEPLYAVLEWVLADEDIAFFADKNKDGELTDAITLYAGEGYAYGIIPVLETLECQNILTPAEYYKAVEAGGDVLLTAILNPLLDRVDVIMENPADEILSILPNLIYFINSNGVDTVVKNTLNAVYTLLYAIEPIAKIDLYELIGLDLSTLTFEKLFEMLLDMIAESTGYEFSNLSANAVAELTVGTLVSYTSKNGKTAYKMIYQSEVATNEMVTVVMRLIVTFIMHENNQEVLIGLLKDTFGMTADAEKYVRGVLDTIATCATETYLGMDKALATIYYLFYGADIAIGETAGGLKDVNAKWQEVLKNMGMSDDPNEKTLGNMLAEFLDVHFDDIFTSEGIAPNGFIAFFQRIIEWFNKIINWFRNLFA